ncbi:hypothetical protein GE09DRAFT_1219952 [Coniochaeta sp. 2T2.1]|nr:hypothetical protein GE09DRAFT_1219952 [Coniochaeta sp. 2T2.1]
MDWKSVLRTTWMVILTPTFFVVKILCWPILRLSNAVLTLLSPVFYTGKLCLAPFVYFYSVLPRFQPLYIFFGSAAFLGLLAGGILLLTSSVLTSATGMQDAEREDDDRRESITYEVSTGTATPVKRLDDIYSSQESDWQWLDKTPDARRRRTPGLLGQTILEEDDDS